jgi:hypothetical protein
VTVEHGLLIAGEVIAGTEFVLRDSSAWWDWSVLADRPDLRSRNGTKATLLVGHWTGGNPRTGPTAGPRVVQAMRGRKREDGTDMSVSIHFVIGWDGLVWQTADLSIATVHVGTNINRRSIGVECCWPGTAEQALRLGVDGPCETRRVRGRPVVCLKPSDALVASWTRLARVLSAPGLGSPVVDIPRLVGTTGMPLSGAGEHWMAPSTTKVDAAGYLLDALKADGWR